MILVTHAVVGASIGEIFKLTPILSFAAGFISHFILDAIPHWQYKLGSLKQNKENPLKSAMDIDQKFFVDSIKIAIDVGLGFTVCFLFLKSGDFINIISGALGGIFPDFLQFVWWQWRFRPLSYLQLFHVRINRKHLANAFTGLLAQSLLIIFFVLIARSV